MKVKLALGRYYCGRYNVNARSITDASNSMKKAFFTILLILLLIAMLPKFF
jgi:hypothetical protein